MRSKNLFSFPLVFLAGLLAACGGGGGGGGGSSGAPVIAPETYLFHSDAAAGSLTAVDPADPANPIVVVPVGVVPLGTVAALWHGSYRNGAVKGLHYRTVLYELGGSFYKINALKAAGPPAPVQVSSESGLTTLCSVAPVPDFADHEQASLVYELPGGDADCAAKGDNVFRRIRAGMGAADAAEELTGGAAPVAPIYDMSQGSLAGVLILDAGGKLQRVDQSFSNTPVDVGPLPVNASVVDYLWTTADGRMLLDLDDEIRLYDPVTNTLGVSLHSAAAAYRGFGGDGNFYYLVEADILYRVPLGGSGISQVVVDESANRLDWVWVAADRLVYLVDDGTDILLRSVPKTGGTATDLYTVGTSGDTVLPVGLATAGNASDAMYLPRYVYPVERIFLSNLSTGEAGHMGVDGTGVVIYADARWIGWSGEAMSTLQSFGMRYLLRVSDDTANGEYDLVAHDAATGAVVAQLGSIAYGDFDMNPSGTPTNLLNAVSNRGAVLAAFRVPAITNHDIWFMGLGAAGSLQRLTTSNSVDEGIVGMAGCTLGRAAPDPLLPLMWLLAALYLARRRRV